MARPDATVVLIAQDMAALLPTWLRHLEQQTHPAANFEVLVIDNGSEDDSADVVQRYARGAPVRIRCLQQHPADTTKARNRAAEEAAGTLLLFLAPDLIPGNRLVERHVAAQRASTEPLCTLGATEPHPQLPPGALTRWFLPEVRMAYKDGDEPHFIDWEAYNLCLSRASFLDVGGFDEHFVFPHFAGSELAWRLRNHGLRGRFLERALAYVWQPRTFEGERRRHYARGYSIHRLAEITQSTELFRRFSLWPNPLRAAYDAMALPFYIRACERGEEDIRIYAPIYRRIFRHEVYAGYTDARKGRPPAAHAETLARG